MQNFGQVSSDSDDSSSIDSDFVGEEYEPNDEYKEEEEVSLSDRKKVINSIHSSKYEERKDETEVCSVCMV